MMCIVLVLSLAACKRKADVDDEMDDEFEYDIPDFDTEYGAYSQGAEWGNNYEGSAVYLDGKTAIVTVAVTSKGEEFKSKDIEKMKQNLKTSLDYISETAKKYGKNAEFVFDNKDLNVEYFDFEGDLEEFEGEDYDGILEQLQEEKIDTAAIRKKYSVDGIAYVFLLNATGDCFAAPHWLEDEVYFFSEGAYIFKDTYDENYDEAPAGPNVYLYNLLQLFGAVPLDFPDATYGYTATLYEQVEEEAYNDIMFSFVQEDGTINPTKITKEITDITAYRIGLTDSFEGLESYPTFEREYPCTITDNFMINTNEGNDMSEYEFSGIDDLEFDFSDEDIEIEPVE